MRIRRGIVSAALVAGTLLLPVAAAQAAEAPSQHADCIGVLSSVQARSYPGADADNLHLFQSQFGPAVVGQFNQQVSAQHGDLTACIQ